MSDYNDPGFGTPPPPPPGGGAINPPPPPGFPPPPSGFPPPPAPPGEYQQPPAPPEMGFPPPPQGGAPYMPPPAGGGYQAYQPGGMNAGGGQLAEPAMRLLARFIDGLLFCGVAFAVAIPFAASTSSSRLSFGAGSSLIGGLIGAAIGIAYEVLMTAQRGQTLGKMAVGIKIVRQDGQPMDLESAALRYSPSIGLSLLGAIPIIGLLGSLGSLILAIANIVMVFSSKESVYDKVGKTRVISVK